MSSFVYNAAKLGLLLGGFNLEEDDFKVALLGPSYTPDPDGQAFFSDISAEASGTGYTAGGQPLQNAALVRDDANDRVLLSADGLIWTVATFVTKGALIYKSSGDPATSPLLAFIDFEEELECAGEDFVLQWHENGILALGD